MDFELIHNAIIDWTGVQLTDGSIIDIHQTVNGENKFVVLSVNPLKVYYFCDITREYEYDANQLIAPNSFNGESEFTIVGNIF